MPARLPLLGRILNCLRIETGSGQFASAFSAGSSTPFCISGRASRLREVDSGSSLGAEPGYDAFGRPLRCFQMRHVTDSRGDLQLPGWVGACCGSRGAYGHEPVLVPMQHQNRRRNPVEHRGELPAAAYGQRQRPGCGQHVAVHLAVVEASTDRREILLNRTRRNPGRALITRLGEPQCLLQHQFALAGALTWHRGCRAATNSVSRGIA